MKLKSDKNEGLVLVPQNMLEDERVNLRVIEKNDVPSFVDWYNDLEFQGEYFPVLQRSKSRALKEFENPSPLQVAMGNVKFITEKKDGTKIGHIGYGKDVLHEWIEIGYAIVPSERKKKDRKRSHTNTDRLSIPHQRHPQNNDQHRRQEQCLNQSGGTCWIKKGGIVRKGGFAKGEYADSCLLGLLREEWKELKMLRLKQKQ
jgi:RimJ/RimL family protein N-acetyltransferase